ncbi:GNAT family N-acetyltransferase [Kurthia gibsonii]|uniref:GNAT family N-acetyltransferase n=1 Tax=Kurthia gibsonii TaxID=33946 RepID=UPI001DA95321|nr:GNAT family N-acetyltransferase [Lactococcus sp.]
MRNKVKIVEMTLENIGDYDDKNQTFEVIGRLIPTYQNDCWSFQEEIYEKSFESKYQEENGLEEYIGNEDSIAFLYYLGEECLGQITLSKSVTQYASIDRLIISKSHRGKGIGTALLNRAREWALEKEMKGFTLETQDINLLACRFYSKNGFSIGSVDNMLYANSKEANIKYHHFAQNY